jgi:Uma2 family endonuclease
MSASAKSISNERNSPEVEAAWRAVPAHLVAEIVGGGLHTMPRPARRHTIAATNLGEELGPPFKRGRGGPGGWVILDEPALHLGPRPDIVVPDLAGWSRTRMPDAVGDDDAPPYYDLAPDWACEVLSPRTEGFDRGEKVPIYAREAVRHVWLVDPIEQTESASNPSTPSS